MAGTRSAARTRLVVAAHFVRAGAVGGAEHMLYNLLAGFGRLNVDLTVLCAREAHLDTEALAALRRQAGTRVLTGAGGSNRFLGEQIAAMRSDLSGEAVLFPNYFVPPLVRRRLGRVVSVLHDMQYRHFPENFTAKKRLWLRAAHALAARRADRVVVLSNAVREDACRWLGHGAGARLSVIPNPISWDRFGEAGPPPLDRPYVLSVAAQYPHKNLATLIQAFAGVARTERDLQLVLAGQAQSGLRGIGGRHAALPGLIDALGIADRVILTGYLDDRTLGGWYRHARVFAFPSLFEGFGMPPVEALGFGIPVLTTGLTAIPETTLGLAHYVHDATSVSEWEALILAATRDPAMFAPAAKDRMRLRAHHAPERIADLYLRLCLGTAGG